jgi:hypothetical protein
MRKYKIFKRDLSPGGQVENPWGTIPFRPNKTLSYSSSVTTSFFNTWFQPQFLYYFQIVLFIVWPWKSIVGQWRIHVTVHRIVKKMVYDCLFLEFDTSGSRFRYMDKIFLWSKRFFFNVWKNRERISLSTGT